MTTAVARARRSVRMRAVQVAVIAVACCGASVVVAQSASAAIPLDQFSDCFIHAYQPSVDGSSYFPSGRVICSGSYSIYLQVCANVKNGSSWYVVTNSCVPSDTTAQYFYGSDTGDYGKWESGVCGHIYRTGDGGYDSGDPRYPNYFIGYQSSQETQCG